MEGEPVICFHGRQRSKEFQERKGGSATISKQRTLPKC